LFWEKNFFDLYVGENVVNTWKKAVSEIIPNR